MIENCIIDTINNLISPKTFTTLQYSSLQVVDSKPVLNMNCLKKLFSFRKCSHVLAND